MNRTVITPLIAIAAASVLAVAPAQATSHRVLHVGKNCKAYDFTAGSFCTITSSNTSAIQVGSRVVYSKALGDPTPGVLDSDLVIDGPRGDIFGHVVLNGATLTGTVNLSGGTGPFAHFRAGPLQVACPAYPDCTWTGPLGHHGEDD